MNARVKRRTRGAWFAAANGHRLRHSPGATKNRMGSSGTTTLKKANSAPACRTNRPTTSARYASTLMTLMTCHAEIGTRLGSSV